MESDPRYEDSVGVPVPSRERDFVKNVSIWRQFRALFLKDLTLQFRAVGTNLCQLLTPIIFILFVGIMQVIVNFILRDHHYPVPGTEAEFLPPVNPGRLLDCSYLNETGSAPHIPLMCREDTLNFFDEFPGWVELLDEINETINGYDEEFLEFVNNTLVEMSERYPNCQKVLFDFPLYYVGKGDGVHFDLEIGNLSSSAKEPDQVMRKGLIGGMVPDKWLYNFSLDFHTFFNDTYVSDLSCPATSENVSVEYGSVENVSVEYGSVQAPLFLKAENQSSFRERLIKIVKEYNLNAQRSASGNDQYNRNYRVSPLSKNQYESVMDYVKNQTWSKVRPHAGIFINNYTSSDEEVHLNYTMIANDLVLTKYRPNNGTGIPTGIDSNETLKSLSLEIHRRNGIVNMMSNALYKMLANETSGEDVVIATYIMPMPSMGMNITIDITTLIGGVLFPFAFSFLIPVFMSSLVKDKFEKHLIMMEQNGLSRWTYWLVTYTFNYILYIPVAVEISLLSFLFKMRLFTQTNYGVLVLAFFLWGHAEVVLGFFLSNFFSRPRTATIIGYLLVISGIVVALILEGLQVLPSDRTPFFLYMLWPPFAFYRLLQYFNLACLSMQCYGIDILSPSGGLNLVTTAMVYLGGSTVVLMIVSVYLSFVLPSEYGVRKNPFFPIIAVFRGLQYLFSKAGVGKQTWKKGKTELETPPPEVRVQVDTTIDEDVLAEENSLRDDFPEDAPVVMYQLRKEYPGSGGNPPHVAVETISLAIQRNECFGLLGPNGAGKTTLISVLTGLYEPTSGIGRIAGYNIRTDIQKIHHHLGVCPQFDIQHADLTSEEHLLFYARLKGVKWRREKEVVKRALRQVNLYEARKRKSKALSGGMRRRLSVAIACIGSPDILILDEPTTGLDPASRRQVWEVIENVKEGRSVILTTHAMEEADHLCTRIGIMNFGRLRCLGTQNRLKSKFGTGYQLAFNCAPGCVSDVEKFLRNNLRKAVHIETYADSCNYKLEKEDLCVSELFEMLDSVKVEVGILDWGIKMTTLEDVFLNIVKHSRDQRTKISSSYCPGWLPCQQCCPRRKELDE